LVTLQVDIRLGKLGFLTVSSKLTKWQWIIGIRAGGEEKENIRIECGLFLSVSGVLTQLESPGYKTYFIVTSCKIQNNLNLLL